VPQKGLLLALREAGRKSDLSIVWPKKAKRQSAKQKKETAPFSVKILGNEMSQKRRVHFEKQKNTKTFMEKKRTEEGWVGGVKNYQNVGCQTHQKQYQKSQKKIVSFYFKL